MAKDIVISVDKLSQALGKELETYNKDVIKTIKKDAKSSMDKLVKETKATAPVGHRRSKHYKNSITSRKEYESELGVEYVWYVKGSDYRLSHLLENGHALHQGGYVNGTKFIKIASDIIIEKYLKNVEEALKNG